MHNNPHEILETVRVKSTHPKSQGAFVEVNKKDYDEKIHGPIFQVTPPAPQPHTPSATPPVMDGLNFESNEVREAAIASGLDFSKVKGTGKSPGIGKKKAITFADVNAALTANQPKSNFVDEAAKTFADDLGFTPEQLAEVKGTGLNGAITSDDLQKFADEQDAE